MVHSPTHGPFSGALEGEQQPLTVSRLPLSTPPRSTPSKYFSATSSRASLGHSENQSMVVQFTRAGYWRIQFLEQHRWPLVSYALTAAQLPYLPFSHSAPIPFHPCPGQPLSPSPPASFSSINVFS